MVAASDGPSADAIQRARPLSASGVEGAEAWIAGALAVGPGFDPAPYLEPIRTVLGEGPEPTMRFVEQVRSGQVPAEDQLKKLAIESRLRAYVFGALALGSGVPRQWRDSARFMLFASERPYFR